MDPISQLKSVRDVSHLSRNDWDLHVARQLQEGPHGLGEHTYGMIEKYVKSAMSTGNSKSPKDHISAGEVSALVNKISSKRDLYHINHEQIQHLQHTLRPFVK